MTIYTDKVVFICVMEAEVITIKKVVVVGTNNTIYTLSELLNPKEMKIVGLGDARENHWNVFDEKGELLSSFEEILPVMPVELVASLEPDLVIISDTDEQMVNNLRHLLIRNGFDGDIIFLHELKEQFSIAGSSLRRLAHRLNSLGVPGSIAELGVYRGDTSWQLNVLFPDRKLYLFDTFEGFDPRDIAKEQELECSVAKAGQLKYADMDELLARLPNKDDVIVKKGWFPETAFDIEDEEFALAYVDVGLYAPTKSGIEFFFPRMSQGGAIVISGVDDDEFGGVSRAVADLEKEFGAFLIVPLGDLKGTLVIMHP